MAHNFFISGDPKSGKTTLLREIVRELREKGLKVGGFISPEERHHGTRSAFHVMSVETGREAILASVDGDGPKVSKYHVDIRAFESIAVPIMERFSEYDVFVIDEIGRMEMKSAAFGRLLDDILESDTPLIATLHEDYVSKYGAFGEVFELSVGNREAVFTRVLRKAKEAFDKKKAVIAKKETAPAKKAKARPEKIIRKKRAARPMPAKRAAIKPLAKAAKKGAGRKAPAAKKKARKRSAGQKRGKHAKEAEMAKGRAKDELRKGHGKGVIHHLKELFHG